MEFNDDEQGSNSGGRLNRTGEKKGWQTHGSSPSRTGCPAEVESTARFYVARSHVAQPCQTPRGVPGSVGWRVDTHEAHTIFPTTSALNNPRLETYIQWYRDAHEKRAWCTVHGSDYCGDRKLLRRPGFDSRRPYQFWTHCFPLAGAHMGRAVDWISTASG
ncbi:hypothetical protein DFH09DRAFT_1079605 [Mycena vulgaris]|nr:hypothetical protein DFH09DRAFT_1079605 [Mycena vulgaris]